MTKQIVSIICQAVPDILGIYLYGSFGTPYATAQSDIDLAILAKKKYSPLECWQLAQKASNAMQRDIDLIDLLQASTVFRFQIVSTAKRIYCKDKLACDCFEMTVYSAYLRFNEERREILQAIKQRGRIYG